MLLSERIEEYIFLYFKQELLPEQQQELEEWLAAEAVNRKYFRGMLKLYGSVDAVQRWEELEAVQQRMWQGLQGRIARRVRRRRWTRVAGVAAAVMLGAGVCLWQLRSEPEAVAELPVAYYEAGSSKAVLRLASGERIALTQEKNREVAELEGVRMRQDSAGRLVVEKEKAVDSVAVTMQTISIPEKGEFHLMLSDGTQVWLNSATELTFPSRFTGGRREVVLTGEAYFEVAEDAAHPFCVTAGGAEVKVLGTAFNVAAYGDMPDISVALLRGSVAFGGTGDAVVLKPGEIAGLNRADGKMTVKEGDVEGIVAWIGGRFNFDEMLLEDLVPQLERWYGVRFEFDDAVCRKCRFTGAATKYRPLSYVLEILASMAPVAFTERDGKIHVRDTEGAVR